MLTTYNEAGATSRRRARAPSHYREDTAPPVHRIYLRHMKRRFRLCNQYMTPPINVATTSKGRSYRRTDIPCIRHSSSIHMTPSVIATHNVRATSGGAVHRTKTKCSPYSQYVPSPLSV